MTKTFMTRACATLAFALGMAVVATPAAAQEFKVIVNSANSTADLSSDVVKSLFLKQSGKFPNGVAAVPVDLGKNNATRSAFVKKVLGRAESAVDSYWQQQIFSGKDVPPAVKTSDDDVIAFVKATPGAIGYVSASAGVAGVKVLDLK